MQARWWPLPAADLVIGCRELDLLAALPSGGAEKGRGGAARNSWRAEVMRSVHRSKTCGRKCF